MKNLPFSRVFFRRIAQPTHLRLKGRERARMHLNKNTHIFDFSRKKNVFFRASSQRMSSSQICFVFDLFFFFLSQHRGEWFFSGENRVLGEKTFVFVCLLQDITGVHQPPNVAVKKYLVFLVLRGCTNAGFSFSNFLTSNSKRCSFYKNKRSFFSCWSWHCTNAE